MLLTRLRNGIISNRKEDVQYQKPDFTVPDYMKSHLLHKHSKTSDAELVILKNEKDKFVCQVTEKKDKGWHQFIVLALIKTIMLKTEPHICQLKNELTINLSIVIFPFFSRSVSSWMGGET